MWIGSTKFFILVMLSLVSCRKSEMDDFSLRTDFSYTEILGRPEGTSITMSFLPDSNTEVYWEYGLSQGVYAGHTQTITVNGGTPVETDFTPLKENTRYYYRIRYREAGSKTDFIAGAENSFQTSRSPGSTFSFAIEADPHLDNNSDTAAYSLTLDNIKSANPDFLIDLGDTFFSEKQPVVNQDVITSRHLLYRPYFGKVCKSSPLFLVLGNHEGESGWYLDGTPGSIGVMTSNTRNLYYPNPAPDSFYSGNINNEKFVGLRKDYYAFQWGDALIVVLDPYWYTATRPSNGWEWTLGSDQYNWFRNVLTTSKAKYKFVFCHNLAGGNTKDARGGAEYAHLFEWGGYNTDGSWGFDTNRPGWGKPIHTLMKENNVTAFFHGHDHFYGKQEKDGIIYQEVPQPSNKNLTNISASQYGYVSGTFLPGRGYLLVTISAAGVKVDYVKTYLPGEEGSGHLNREIGATYTISK